MSAWIIEQRRPASAAPWLKNWTEVSGTYTEDKADMERELSKLAAYDEYYCLTGWEYRVVETKKRRNG